jgi:hypothetical protein
MGVAGGVYGKVEGLNKTITALQRFGVEAQDLKDVMAAIAAEGARLASGYAPSRKGNLRRTVRGNKAKAKAIVIAGRARVSYAGPVNYGWHARGIRPALFMQKADAALAPRAVEMLETGLDRLIRETGLEND